MAMYIRNKLIREMKLLVLQKVVTKETKVVQKFENEYRQKLRNFTLFVAKKVNFVAIISFFHLLGCMFGFVISAKLVKKLFSLFI